MNNWEKQNPSFSSTLLDKICRSIDDGDTKGEELRFCRETMVKKHVKQTVQLNKFFENSFSGNWRKYSTSKQSLSVHQRRELWSELDPKSKLDQDYDHDATFFSSGSNSSESSSGGLSSSDIESIHGAKPNNSCFLRPKPIRTGSEKTDRTGRALFFDDYHFSSESNQNNLDVHGFIKSKSRALKIYSNLKNLKQPISPGGRLAGFLNSIFTAGNGKKSKNPSSTGGQRVSKSAQQSTCSSASSFSRSCLSKNSPASREKLRNGIKRSVRFCPVSVIVDEDLQPCGHKSLYQEESNLTSELNKLQAMEKSRRVEEAARDFLKKYHQKQSNANYDDYYEDEEEEDDEDAASCSSSDLFELDHLAVMGRDRYREELPVYETTRVDRNRAIANGLMM